jgi:polysaccharide biosynthesis protein PelA
VARIGPFVTIGAAACGIGAALAFHARTPPPAASARRPVAPARAPLERGPEPGPFSMAPSTDPRAPLDGELPRRVLALYDSSEVVIDEGEDGHLVESPMSPELSLIHRLAELPLNHLGLVVDYRDVNAGLPAAEEMGRFRGVVTWFSDNRMRDPEAYLGWLGEQAAAGRRVVSLEYPGAFEDLAGRAVAADALELGLHALGGQYLGESTDDSSVIAVLAADGLMAFERKLPARLDLYQKWQAEPGAQVHLRLERTDLEASASDAVWTSTSGGFVMPSYAYAEERLGERYVTRWLIDPFRFFEEALGVAGWPRPDFTTLNGRRIFYSQVDGDGLEMITELDYKSRCGAIIRDRVFARYDLPFTASVVVGQTAPPPLGVGAEVDVEVARSIFALPNVEVASHGLAHPLDWRAGDKAELSVPGLPGYRMTGEAEIADSVAYIDRELAPPGKPCRIMLWTGWCNPSAEQLQVAYRLGLRNLNGGDPRMDAHYPSYAHLVPPVHQVGGAFQFFTSAANDYILTDDWNPPYYRFQNVVQTFERSGAPRRVVPVDVYFHYYIARNLAGLTGLERVLSWASRQPLAPVFASEYVDLVRDFHWARLGRDADGAWTVRKGPALRTVRFDDPTMHVDLERSFGVIGYLQVPELGATYVHLDGSPRVVIVRGEHPPARPYLSEASHAVDDLRIEKGRISFRTHGPGARSFVFAGLPLGTRWGDEVVDGQGRLTVSGPVEQRP